jgi:hypothetical protein
MLDLTHRASRFHPLKDQRANSPNYSKQSSSQSFATRFSAAVSSVPEHKTPSNLGPSRSNSVMVRARKMLASVASDVAPVSTGSKDARDGISDLAGQVTGSGAPSIVRLTTPIANQWGYSGEAAFNPYFTTPGNPMRDGLVTGFSQWFEQNHINGLGGGDISSNYSTTQEGAQEALRLAQQYEPNATLGSSRFGSSGGPWLASKDTYEIVMPNGNRVNAGLLLGSYYNQGQGVTPLSDRMLQLGLKSA